ncbi:hypothetical protein Plhal703r1_c06g0031341 [Plasmopara halstedii]
MSYLDSFDVVGAQLNLVNLPESDVYFQVTMEDAKAKKVSVHVLVVIPTEKTDALAATRGAASSMAIPAAEMTETSVTLEEVRRAEENRQELTYYQERGLDELYSEDKDPLPFICVEGSSGMGKSQLHMLWRAGDRIFTGLPLLLELVLKAKALPQFSSISNAFCEMVKKDNPTKKSEEEILNTSSKVYRNGLLWTYGFIRALLE